MIDPTESAAAPEMDFTRLPSSYADIHVPVDGTRFAEAAVPAAAELAARGGGVLHLVTVVPDPEADSLIPEEGVLARPGSREFATRVREYLEDLKTRVSERWDCTVMTRLLQGSGSPHAHAEFARDEGMDLVVVASRSRGVVARAFMGSLSTDLARQAPCPVLLVHADEDETGSDSPGAGTELIAQEPVQLVGAALDGSLETDRAVLRNAYATAALWDARIRLVQAVVSAPGGGVVHDPAAGAETAASTVLTLEVVQDRLEAAVKALKAGGREADFRVLPGVKPAPALVTFVQEEAVDLLVMGTHHKGMVERIMVGSISDRVARSVERTGVMVCPGGKVEG